MIWTIFITILKNNPNKKRKTLIVFDDMIADMVSNKKLYPIVTGLFIRRRKLNISLVCVMHYFVMKIPNKRELQQIAFSH